MTVKDIIHARKGKDDKTQYQNVGILLIKDDGKMSIKLNAIPTEWDGWLQVYDKKPKDSGAGSDRSHAANEPDPFG
jgi:hypothetical protein